MDKQYKISACLLIKDEGRYLPEWLAWHTGQGVEHFYIYDNGSAVPVVESVPAEYAEKVTVVDFPPPRRSTQTEAYADCLARFGGETEWMAFLDTDEFLRVVDGRPLAEFLEDYPDADAVLAKWVVYNANGLLEDDGRPVRERFTQTCPFPENMPQCKSIVRAGRVKTMGAHGPIATECSLWVVNEDTSACDAAAGSCRVRSSWWTTTSRAAMRNGGRRWPGEAVTRITHGRTAGSCG